MKKISIIVPVYNTSSYLRDCLDSISNQTLEEIEVIIVDDGSTDLSSIICDEYASNDKFKVFHNHNQGVSASRNFGIVNAEGEFIMFVDSDDWLEKDFCEKMYQIATSKRVDLVICAHYNESTLGSKVKLMFPEDKEFKNEDFRNDIQLHTLGLIGEHLKKPSLLDRHTPVWARLYRANIIKDNNIKYIDLDLLPSECLQFNFEFTSSATSAYYLSVPLYHYRRNTSQSVTKPYRKRLVEKWNWWYTYIIEHYSNSFDDEYMQAFRSRICCSVIPLGGNALKLNSYTSIRNECKEILNNKSLIQSFKTFDYTSCAIYWRIFFMSAKYRWVDLFILLSWCMRRILDLRKK